MFTVYAATINNPLGGISTVADLVSRFLTPIYPLAGILLVALLIYGGFTYMTSAGDPQKVKSAQGIITNAIIGLVIVLCAFLITQWLGRILGTTII